MVPNQFGPPRQMVFRIFRLSKETGCGVQEIRDQIGWGPFVQRTKFSGTICPWGPIMIGTVCPGGPNWMGTICPWGPNLWGPFVHGDRKWGTGSPGIKWVRDQMSRNRWNSHEPPGNPYIPPHGPRWTPDGRPKLMVYKVQLKICILKTES